MIIVGIGAQSAATADDIVEAVRECCGRAGIALSEAGVLAGLDRAETRAALEAAAKQLGVTAEVWTAEQLREMAPRCVTSSERSLAATGVPSIAEAAALAASGPDGMLLLPRFALARVTAALAIGPGGTTP